MKGEPISPPSLIEANLNRNGYTFLERLPSFRHSVLKVADVDGSILYVKQYVDHQSFCMERAALERLHASEQPFAIPEVVGLLSDRRIHLLSEVQGRPTCQEDMSTSFIRNVATHLRGLHDGTNMEGFARVDYAHLLRVYEEHIAPSPEVSISNKMVALATIQRLQLFFEKEGDKVVAHGDFNQSNLLYNQKDERFGLIDFERTAIGYRSTDLARAAWRIFNNDPEAIKLLLQSYYDCWDVREYMQEFKALQAYDYVGAVAYFAKEGYRKNYPFYSAAVERLETMKFV